MARNARVGAQKPIMVACWSSGEQEAELSLLIHPKLADQQRQQRMQLSRSDKRTIARASSSINARASIYRDKGRRLFLDPGVLLCRYRMKLAHE